MEQRLGQGVKDSSRGTRTRDWDQNTRTTIEKEGTDRERQTGTETGTE